MKRNVKDSQGMDFYSTLSSIIDPSTDSPNASSTSGYQTSVLSTLGSFFKNIEIYDQLKEINLNTHSPSDSDKQRSLQRFNLKRNNIDSQDKTAEQYSPYFFPRNSGNRNRRIEAIQLRIKFLMPNL
ncbi:hypothetical protein CEXT_12761 [Caerostris extrusa]|uniref:Uncharacterized protein n=1 Tax=Caerostris extrusa TaxID=172846 RepID=A0AAV4YAM3_CAEEX|nr:hypothetical protein CEXT_12761 [Caerostris extrusa]